MELKKILDELKEEIHNTVSGSFYQFDSREETEIMIHQIIEEDFEKILKKYAET